MQKTILQVPIDQKLRTRAASAARLQGFSSLQEPIRLFLQKLAERELTFKFEFPPVKLSKRAAARYDKMIRDIESGREPVFTAHSVDELMDDLHGHKSKT